jgi:hypothetical protein
MAKKEGNGYGIAGLVLGILGILVFIIPFFNLLMPILAIVFAVKQRKQSSNGVATSALVLGIVGLVIAVIYDILLIIGLSMPDTEASLLNNLSP